MEKDPVNCNRDFQGKHHRDRDFCVLSLLTLQFLEQCLTHEYIFGE